jgi:hypothetical protein
MRRFILILGLPLLVATPAAASPLSDCIDKLTANCKGDWGDATYRACFKGATSHCESVHPKPAPKDIGLTSKPRQSPAPTKAKLKAN